MNNFLPDRTGSEPFYISVVPLELIGSIGFVCLIFPAHFNLNNLSSR